MNQRRWSNAAAVVLVATVVASIGGVSLLGRDSAGDWSGETATLLLPALFFSLVGAIIILRRPGNRMGWLFGLIGWLNATGSLADEYANRALAEGRTEGAGVVLAAWYSEWFWIPFIFMGFCFVVLLFPSGQPPSPRWRPFLRVVVGVMALLTIAGMLDPYVVPSGVDVGVRNPIGINGVADVDEAPLVFLLLPTLLVGALAALSSLVLRFRRSAGEERQQLKWFTFSAVALIGSFILFGVLDLQLVERFPILEALTFSLLPIGAGIAILKYRLYDIDVIINRTLVYAVLTAVLVGTYAGGVLLFRTLLAPVTGDSDLAIAASTLVVAALFGPARGKVQGFIDRRFYRSRYDAQQTLEAFAVRLRDEVDVDELSKEVVRVVSQTVSPHHASVWLTQRSSS